MNIKLLQKYKVRRYQNKMVKLMDKNCSILEDESINMLNAINVVESKYGHKETVFNELTISVFIKLSMIDIFLLFKLFFKSNDEKERNILARTMAIHISEFIFDVGNLIGKPLGNLMKDFPEDEDLKGALNSCRVCYNQIKMEYLSMKEIRNYVSAHKDRDVRKQLEVNAKLDYDNFEVIVIIKFGFFAVKFTAYERLLLKKRGIR